MVFNLFDVSAKVLIRYAQGGVRVRVTDRIAAQSLNVKFSVNGANGLLLVLAVFLATHAEAQHKAVKTASVYVRQIQDSRAQVARVRTTKLQVVQFHSVAAVTK